MTERMARWAGIGVAAAMTLLVGLSQVVALAVGNEDQEPLLLLALTMVGLIGAVLVAKRPTNPVSWLLAGAGLLGGVAGLVAAAEPAALAEELTGWQMATLLLGGPSWYGFILLVAVLVPLLFPTGRPPSPRWRWVGWGATTSVIGACLLWVLQEQFCLEDDPAGGCVRSAPNPLGVAGVAGPEDGMIGSALFAVLLICLVAAMVSMVVRYRRARGIERQQLKWLVFAIALFVGEILLVETLWAGVLGHDLPAWYLMVSDLIWVAIPGSIAIAVLRYRLYEIDRLVSRTVSYGLLTAVLVGVYVGGVFGLGALVRSFGGEADTPLVVAASTLVVAAVFGPARRWIQGVIDRRFNRARYDAGRVVEEFGHRLRDEIDLEELAHGLTGTITTAIQPSRVGLWWRLAR